MSPREAILVLGMCIVTFGIRYPILALVSRVELPPHMQRALVYIPPAVLTAIIAPAVVAPSGSAVHLHWSNAYLVAALCALLIAWRSTNLLLTIAGGMVIFWLWRAVVMPFAG